MSLKENGLYQLVEAPGGFALYIGGTLFVDDLGKILASWAVRNGAAAGSFERGPVGTLTLAQWNGYPHKDLKGNTVL